MLLVSGMINCTAQTQTIQFSNGAITLAGDLMLPKGAGPFPAVVFLHGSGPSTRAESRQRAKWLLKAGFAVLTYDKRGVGASEGDENFHRYYNFDTLASDGLAAIRFLAQHAAIDQTRIGVIAASQSGWVAPLIAKDYPALRFMVLISPSVCTVGEDNLFERNRRLQLEGFSAQDLEEVQAMHHLDIQLSRNGQGMDQYTALWSEYQYRPWFKRVYLSDAPMPVDHSYRLWYKTVVDHDPVNVLKQLDIPILWLFGDAELDRFGPVERSLDTLKKLEADQKAYQIHQYPGADHNLNKSDYKEDLLKWCRHQVDLK